MTLDFTPKAWAHYLHWQQNDKAILRRLNRLIENCLRTPYEGIGDPEVLKYDLAGFWSRRITDEHRLVYKVTDNSIQVISCRFHY